MKKARKNKRKVSNFVYWTPRVLTILYIIFIGIFALDVFDSKSSASQIMTGLLMHLIPNFFLIIILVIAWKYEWFGAFGLFLFLDIYVFTVKGSLGTLLNVYEVIVFPLLITGLFWWLCWVKKQ